MILYFTVKNKKTIKQTTLKESASLFSSAMMSAASSENTSMLLHAKIEIRLMGRLSAFSFSMKDDDKFIYNAISFGSISK